MRLRRFLISDPMSCVVRLPPRRYRLGSPACRVRVSELGLFLCFVRQDSGREHLDAKLVMTGVTPFKPLAGSSIGRTSAFGAGCWRFEPSPASQLPLRAEMRFGPGSAEAAFHPCAIPTKAGGDDRVVDRAVNSRSCRQFMCVQPQVLTRFRTAFFSNRARFAPVGSSREPAGEDRLHAGTFVTGSAVGSPAG